MMLPDEKVMNLAVAKVGLILMTGFSIVVYLARLAARISFSKSGRIHPDPRES